MEEDAWVGLADAEHSGVHGHGEQPPEVEFGQAGIQVAGEIGDHPEPVVGRQPLEHGAVSPDGREGVGVERIRQQGRCDAVRLGGRQPRAQQPRLRVDGGAEAEAADLGEPGEGDVGGGDERLEPGVRERATGRAVRRVETGRPMDPVRVDRAAEIQQQRLGRFASRSH